MSRLDFLDRFRPVGAPGSAGPTGVPTREATGPAAELAPVFAQLAPVVRECAAMVADASSTAETRRATAHETASAVVAEAQHNASAERDRAAAHVVRVSDAEVKSMLHDARDEAARLMAEAAGTRPDLVARAVSHVRAVSGQ